VACRQYASSLLTTDCVCDYEVLKSVMQLYRKWLSRNPVIAADKQPFRHPDAET